MRTRIFYSSVAFLVVAMLKSWIRDEGADATIWMVAACYLLLLAIYVRMGER